MTMFNPESTSPGISSERPESLAAAPQTAPAEFNAQGWPAAQGLYDPQNEKDSCGVGIVANIKGVPSNQIVQDALTALVHMSHRGGCGCEANTGDGAGILTGMPYGFIAKVAKQLFSATLPEKGQFGAGLVFLPPDEAQRKFCKDTFTKVVTDHGQKLIGWRRVPTDSKKADVGPTALKAEPVIEMPIIAAAPGLGQEAFERKLYMIRKLAFKAIRRDSAASNVNLSQAGYTTSARSRARSSSTRASSLRSRSARTTLTSQTRTTPVTWRWCTRASARTPSRRGIALSRCAS